MPHPSSKKLPRPNPDAPPLVDLAYQGEAERRYHDPRTGTDYRFRAGEVTAVPRDIAQRLHEADSRLYAFPDGGA